jgi:hypothetical protein
MITVGSYAQVLLVPGHRLRRGKTYVSSVFSRRWRLMGFAVYANSLLATLNTRRSLRNASHGTADTVPMSGIRWKSHPQTSTGTGEGNTTTQSSNATSSGGPRTPVGQICRR